MNIIKSIFKSRDTPKNYMGDNVGGGRYFLFGRAWAGKSVTERTAMQITAVYTLKAEVKRSDLNESA